MEDSEESKINLFIKTFVLIRDNKLKFSYMLFFDFLFVLSITAINFIAAKTLPSDPKVLVSLNQVQMMSLILFFPFYYLFVIFAYSFFKYYVLHIIASLFSEVKFSIKKLLKFYLVNIILFTVFAVISAAIAYSYIYSIKPDSLKTVLILTAIPFALLYYSLLNILHSSFIQTHMIKDTLAGTFEVTFKRSNLYLPLILATTACFAVYSVIYSFFIINLGAVISNIITLVVSYSLISFTRIYYYSIAEQENVLS